jgi:hypothetical protein
LLLKILLFCDQQAAKFIYESFYVDDSLREQKSMLENVGFRYFFDCVENQECQSAINSIVHDSYVYKEVNRLRLTTLFNMSMYVVGLPCHTDRRESS